MLCFLQLLGGLVGYAQVVKEVRNIILQLRGLAENGNGIGVMAELNIEQAKIIVCIGVAAVELDGIFLGYKRFTIASDRVHHSAVDKVCAGAHDI